jgi:hypothetical protein
MVSDNKSRKSFCLWETAENGTYKQDIRHKSGFLEKPGSLDKLGSLENSQVNENGEQIKHAQKESTDSTGGKKVVEDTPENLLICMEYCGTCPSMPFPPEPLLFCSRGCSSEIVLKKSCNCPACPIYKKHRLQNLYFCEFGKATERKEEERKA